MAIQVHPVMLLASSSEATMSGVPKDCLALLVTHLGIRSTKRRVDRS
jgi:hypothetical protein